MLQSDFYSSLSNNFSSSLLLPDKFLSLASSADRPLSTSFTNFILFPCCTGLVMPNTNWNKSTYVMQHHLHLYTQKRDDMIEFLFNLTGLTGLDCFGLGCNNPHEFGKFDATASSDAKNCLALWFFHLVCIVNFLNQVVRLGPERARNLNLLDSE